MSKNFIRSGLVSQARTALEQGLEKQSPGTELLSSAVDVYLAEGEIDLALESLKQVVQRHPRNVQALEKLAVLQRWTLHPLKSLETYERLMALSPEREDISEHLIHDLRYYGQREKAVSLMAERILAWKSVSPEEDRFIFSLTTLLKGLAQKRRENGPDPMRDHALEQNYLLLEQYRKSEKNEDEKISFLIYVFENCLAAGLPELSRTFADRYDLSTGIPKAAQALSRVFQWNAMPSSALETIVHAMRRFPDNKVLLKEALALARFPETKDRSDVLISMLQGSEVVEYREQAALLAAGLDRFEQAAAISGSLPEPAKVRTLDTILRKALPEAPSGTIAAIVAWADSLSGGSPSLDAALAQGYARLGKTERSRTYWLRAISQASVTDPIQTSLLGEAVSSNDPQVIAKATAILRNHNSPESRIRLRTAALQLAAQERYPAAFDTLRVSLSSPPDPGNLENLLRWAGYAGDPARLKTASDLVSGYAGDNTKLLRLAADVNGWLEDGTSAAPFLQTLIKRFPCDMHIARKALALAGKGKRAVTIARRVLSCPSVAPTVAFTALQILDQENRSDEVLSFLSPRINHPVVKDTLEQWVEIAEKLGLHDLAFTGYTRLWNGAPNRSRFGRSAARLASWTDRYVERAEILEQLAQQNPDHPTAALEAALALEEIQKPEKALSLYLRVARTAPDTPNLLPRIFRLQGELGLRADRIQLLKSTRARRRLTRQESRYVLEDALRLGRPEEALEVVNEFATKAITSIQDLMPVVRILISIGKHSEARALMDQSRKSMARNKDSLLALGTAALQYNFLHTALSSFKQVLTTEPFNAAALKGSAMIYAALSDPDRAITFFRRYLRQRPDDAGARYQLGELLFVNSRRGEAYAEYAKALDTLQ